MTHRTTSRLVVIATGLCLWGACSDGSTSATAIRQAQLAEGCSLNSDCRDKLVCAFQTCHVQCASSVDCGGARCVESERPVYVCQSEKEKNCVRNSDCAGKAVCGPDGQCRDGCASARDCLADQTCTSGVCALAREIVDGGLPTPAEPPAPEGTPCVHATDCPNALVCVGGFCGPECITSKDCFVSWQCLGTRCVPPEAQDAATR